MRNEYIEYYGENNISPVHQDISDFDIHMKRRKKLYRQLGIPVKLFRDAKILEVGPGGGYNTLCFFKWGAKHIDLVEPNIAGIEDMRENFSRYSIDHSIYDIFNDKIEDFSGKNYDIIIAEGFLMYLENSGEIVQKLKQMVNDMGIIVVTCADDPGDFIETMKRMIAHSFIKASDCYSERVKILSRIFEKQLNSLRGVSRPIEDWVQDQFLNPAFTNGVKWTIADAIKAFSPEFEVLGSSPQILSDWSWYKDIWFDTKTKYLEQYMMRRAGLFLSGIDMFELSKKQIDELQLNISSARQAAYDYEISYDSKLFIKAAQHVDALARIVENINLDLYSVFCQMSCAFQDLYKLERNGGGGGGAERE